MGKVTVLHRGEKVTLRDRQRPRRLLSGGWMSAIAITVAAGVGYFSDGMYFRAFDTAKDQLQGRAIVVDGDTIELTGQRVRFNGIDAPESAQECKTTEGSPYRCGAKAASALDSFLAASRPIRCEFVEWDQYGRFVGDCFRADGLNVAAWLVENGHALDWPRYSNGAYADAQATAREAKLGIWAGSFQEPWSWRAEHRDEAQSRSVSLVGGAVGCKIKGNINAKGERIYHIPGQEHYDDTRISTGKGERWFCSEGEARGAGWRRAKR